MQEEFRGCHEIREICGNFVLRNIPATQYLIFVDSYIGSGVDWVNTTPVLPSRLDWCLKSKSCKFTAVRKFLKAWFLGGSFLVVTLSFYQSNRHP